MKAADINDGLIKNYLGLIKNMSAEGKLELIERLSKTLKSELKDKSKSVKELFGKFEGDKSADEIISGIRNARTFNRKTEEL